MLSVTIGYIRSHVVQDRRLILRSGLVEIELFVETAAALRLRLHFIFFVNLLPSVRAVEAAARLYLHRCRWVGSSGTWTTAACAAQPCYLLVEHFVYVVFVDLVSVVVILVLVGGAFLAENFETIDGWNVSKGALLGIEIWISLEKDVREREAEVRTVNIKMLLPWNVHLLASWAISLYPTCGQFFTQAYR